MAARNNRSYTTVIWTSDYGDWIRICYWNIYYNCRSSLNVRLWTNTRNEKNTSKVCSTVHFDCWTQPSLIRFDGNIFRIQTREMILRTASTNHHPHVFTRYVVDCADYLCVSRCPYPEIFPSMLGKCYTWHGALFLFLY